MFYKRMTSIVIVVLIIFTGLVFMLFQNRDQTESSTPKEDIIRLFDENSELFIAVAEYSKETEGIFEAGYIRKKNTLSIVNYYNEAALENMDTNVKKAIKKILARLKFSHIMEYSAGELYFVKDAEADEKGICYLEGDIHPEYLHELEKIMDNWYYYRSFHE